MKRGNSSGSNQEQSSGASSVGGGSCSMVAKNQDAGGMDDLLAILGYKVRSSDMAEVAQKLEQLEVFMGSAQEDGISHLASDTVHYNPSDVSGWLESMLSVLDTPPVHNHHNSSNHNHVVIESCSRVERDSASHENSRVFDDLSAIPGGAIYPQSDTEPYSKRLKAEDVVISPVPEVNRPVVLVDSQETGVRLVHTLMACAEAVQHGNLQVADSLVKHIGLLAVSQVGSMRKVATYFAEALARRIYGILPQGALELSSYSKVLEMHFYETCPYLKFAHFTANQALLEAFATANRVHVIDFGLMEGTQWPALMQALALRPGGPPAFRLTGIGPPQPDNTDALQQVGWKLARMAETIGIEFEFRGFFVNCLADLEPSILDIRPPEVEAVAVNSVFELHPLLAHPGAIEKVLNSIKAMKPLIVTVVEQEANHNGPVFLDRFNEALHYYSSLFDSLEGCPPSQDLVMSEIYLGRQICNVVACEGAARVERHETLAQWRSRMDSGGFIPVPLGSNAFNQASMLLSLFAGGSGYKVEETNGCLLLAWHTRPLIATSAWKLTTIGSN